MTGRPPEVSVVVPTCGRSDLLRGTLEALAAQDYPPARYEVLVQVDGPDPAARAVVAEVARHAPCAMSAGEHPRGGAGRARNAGIARARGRIVVMLDDDIVAAPQLLRAHAEAHGGADDRVIVGLLPVERTEPEPAHARLVRQWWDGVHAERLSPAHRATFRDFVTGNVSVSRARLLAAGGFDADFAGYGREDYELGHRLLSAGLCLRFAPDAVGLHRFRKPVLRWVRQMRDQGRADVLFARKHPSLAVEIMGLSPFPLVPWCAPVVARAERLVVAKAAEGGPLWERAAALAQSAHYWRGIVEAVRDRAELRALAAAQRLARGWEARLAARDRVALALAWWAA
ncbi:MAG TPA: glycosyltransferase [Gemmatimonadaceae bacterium]|nr:glycosyltransferase [Gemmatimonadaceae bacterium]